MSDKTGQMQVDRDQPSGKKITANNINRVFYDNDDTARSMARRLSRLSNFKREKGRLNLANDFRPLLTLGALLKVRRDLSSKIPANIAGDYLLCVQPRCDAVRLSGARAFPFQQAQYDNARFNLIVDEPGPNGYLKLDLKPMNAVMLKFKPKKGDDAVFAQRQQDGTFLFKDTLGRSFEWVGDIGDLKAQRFASEVGANMHRVGVDELEWLRRGSQGEIRPDQRDSPVS